MGFPPVGGGVYEVPYHNWPPTYYPFAIPEITEKPSLISGRVKLNRQDGAKPPTFRLDSWEALARALSRVTIGPHVLGYTLNSRTPFGPSDSRGRPGGFFASTPRRGGQRWSWVVCLLAGSTARTCANRRWHASSNEFCHRVFFFLVHYLDDPLLVFSFVFLTHCGSSKSTQDCAWESGRLRHMIQWIPATRGTWQRHRVHMRISKGSLMR